VVHDANRNGKVDPGEEPIDGAVLVLDAGARSEQVRKGAYRFDAIRSGDHVVALLRDSLPEGALITGATEVPLALKRDQLSVEIDFAVAIEKRPETRRVFPAKIGAPPPAPRPGAANQPADAAPPPARPAPARTAPSASSGLGRVSPVTPLSAPTVSTTRPQNFAVQIAALNDPIRARAMVRDLATAGYPAYLISPAADDPDAPYRIRIGGYRSRTAATAAAAKLERLRHEKLWVIREAGQ
jgi:cell division septation protein DedD